MPDTSTCTSNKLLNIQEAADFLNVSQMTIRRWTNKGLLKCYRLGSRGMRRFSKEDLMDFLNNGSNLPNGVEVKTDACLDRKL